MCRRVRTRLRQRAVDVSVVLPVAASQRVIAPWFLALAGFAAMYLPSHWAASQHLWQTEEHGHMPLILAVSLWLFWRARDLADRVRSAPAPVTGWLAFSAGVVLYAIGRSFTVSSIEFLSQLFVVTAIVLVLKGPFALRAMWFSVAYLVFMVPLPATLVDAVTGPLKQWISVIVVDVLHQLGYPISRTGVMITIGNYQLLVADACSGLNSMISLSALGALYMHLVARTRWLHNALMIAAILPIAFAANIVRVITLVLITYHLGDEAGQGFLHSAAGLSLFLVALALFFALDTCAAVLFSDADRSSTGCRQIPGDKA